MTRTVKLDIQHRYIDSEEMAEILNVATCLDPPFKTNYIKDTELEATKQKLVDKPLISKTAVYGSKQEFLN